MPGVTSPDTSPGRSYRRPPVPRREVASAGSAEAVAARKKARMPSGFASIRDILSFVAGLCVIGNEVFLQDAVEIAILTVGVALCGLPVVFGADEKRSNAGAPPADPPPAA